MNKITKIRKLVLFITLGLVALGIIFSVLAILVKKDFYNEFNRQIASGTIVGLLPKENEVGALTIIISLISPWLFYIFALVYIFRNGNTRVQNRRWPYIVMVVLGAVFILLHIYTAYTVMSNKTGLLSVKQDKMPDADYAHVKDQIASIWKTYESKHTFYIVAGIVLGVATLALNAAQLVLIKKAKDSSDVEYSKEIVAAAQAKEKQNDLP